MKNIFWRKIGCHKAQKRRMLSERFFFKRTLLLAVFCFGFWNLGTAQQIDPKELNPSTQEYKRAARSSYANRANLVPYPPPTPHFSQSLDLESPFFQCSEMNLSRNYGANLLKFLSEFGNSATRYLQLQLSHWPLLIVSRRSPTVASVLQHSELNTQLDIVGTVPQCESIESMKSQGPLSVFTDNYRACLANNLFQANGGGGNEVFEVFASASQQCLSDRVHEQFQDFFDSIQTTGPYDIVENALGHYESNILQGSLDTVTKRFIEDLFPKIHLEGGSDGYPQRVRAESPANSVRNYFNDLKNDANDALQTAITRCIQNLTLDGRCPDLNEDAMGPEQNLTLHAPHGAEFSSEIVSSETIEHIAQLQQTTRETLQNELSERVALQQLLVTTNRSIDVLETAFNNSPQLQQSEEISNTLNKHIRTLKNRYHRLKEEVETRREVSQVTQWIAQNANTQRQKESREAEIRQNRDLYPNNFRQPLLFPFFKDSNLQESLK